MRLRGIGVSPGIASGRALVLETRDLPVFCIGIPDREVDREVGRFREAVGSAKKQIEDLRERIAAAVGDAYARVFAAHLLILEDRPFIEEVEGTIRADRVNAEWALEVVGRRILDAFDRIEDPYHRERGGDVEDVYTRLQMILAGEVSRHDLSKLSEDSVVIATSLSPSDAALLNHEHVVAFCTDAGGRTSHTAILANALEVPAVAGLKDITRRVRGGDPVIVDGMRGEVLLRPSPSELASHDRERARLAQRERRLEEERALPATTLDGQSVELLGNVEFPAEVPGALRNGALGIGLYRSEFLFLSKAPALPTEEEHRAAYEDLADRAAPGEVVVRTLDLGGDKYFHEVLENSEANPVMGLRAIRLCLRREDIFRAQLRGLLRASARRNIRVMFPMISGIQELRQARALMDEVRSELQAEGHDINPDLEVGVMIEVPSAALIADMLAREVDFFSIGTNDLLQYCLALDRGNESVAYLYQPLHPAFLRLLERIVTAASSAGIPVGLCGEMASDPLAIPVLIGLGLRRLSANPLAIPEMKSAVRRIDTGHAAEVVSRLMGMATAEEIEKTVRIEFGLTETDREGTAGETAGTRADEETR